VDPCHADRPKLVRSQCIPSGALPHGRIRCSRSSEDGDTSSQSKAWALTVDENEGLREDDCMDMRSA
jgi:hypothetical protein